MTAADILQTYIVPNIPAIVATLSTVAAYIKCAGGAKKIVSSVTDKVNTLKQDKLLEELVNQNKILLEDNAKLRKQLNQLIEIEGKVKIDEKG